MRRQRTHDALADIFVVQRESQGESTGGRGGGGDEKLVVTERLPEPGDIVLVCESANFAHSSLTGDDCMDVNVLNLVGSLSELD